MHPLGKSPVISDGGATVAESGAIVEYLIERHGGGRLRPPAGHRSGCATRYWLHYAEGSAMPPLLLEAGVAPHRRAAGAVVRAPDRARHRGRVRDRFVGPQIKLHLDYLEGELAARDWFAGRSSPPPTCR